MIVCHYYLNETEFEKNMYLFEILENCINYQIKVYNLTYEDIKGKNVRLYCLKLEKFIINLNNIHNDVLDNYLE